jgi:poly-gamma-glutamate capsule biosynthesis protein CapA/YwtB (metallophosphatase superfamily)
MEDIVRRTVYTAICSLLIWCLFSCTGLTDETRPVAEAEGSLGITPPEISLVAVGDINLGRKAGRIILSGDVDYAFAKTKDIISGADIAFGNLESTISEQNGITQNGVWCFTAPPIAAETLAHAGFDVVSLANNHVWDFGKRALLSTPDYLDQVGIRHAGTGATLDAAYTPAMLSVKGIRIAFFSATRIFNFGGQEHEAFTYTAWLDMKRLSPAITKAKGEVDLVIVAAHWGAEYQDRPADENVKLAHEMVDAGADIILGGHPHVPQGIERYNNAFIIYSLGNFAYHQTTEHSIWKTRSIILKLILTKDGVKSYEMIPVTCGFQPAVAEGALGDEILAHMEKISGYFK